MKGKKHGKAHMRAEMGALKKGGAPKGVMAAERAEYGMRDGGMVKGKAHGGGKSHPCKPA